MKLLLSCASVSIAALLSAPGAARSLSDNTLAEAQDLYAQASYEQALSVLEGLNPKEAATLAEGQTIRRYRALCFLALGRSADAETAVEDMVRAEPAGGLTEDVPPRLQSLVQQVRGRVVRELVRQGYQKGRDLYERGQFEAAAGELKQAVALIDDGALGLTNDPAFTDLRLVADGFVKLATAARAAAPPSAETAGTTPPAAPAAVGADRGTRTELGLVPPEPIVQDLPPFPRIASGLLSRNEGELEIDVGADGRVTAARIVRSIHPAYDVMLTAAAKSWRYQPARRYGEPVPYTKRVNIRVQPK